MVESRCKIGFAGCCTLLISLGIAIPMIVGYPSLIRPYPNPGKVISEDCTMTCMTNEGCIYGGTIDIAYNYSNQSYLQTVPANGACEPDCCQTLIQSGKTIWLELNQTHQIINYDITRKTTAALFMVTAAFLLLCALGVVVVSIIGLCQYLSRWLYRSHHRYESV